LGVYKGHNLGGTPIGEKWGDLSKAAGEAKGVQITCREVAESFRIPVKSFLGGKTKRMKILDKGPIFDHKFKEENLSGG